MFVRNISTLQWNQVTYVSDKVFSFINSICFIHSTVHYPPLSMVISLIHKKHCVNMISVQVYTQIFYKQPVYKQLALAWQIAKQLSGLNALSLRNRKIL